MEHGAEVKYVPEISEDAASDSKLVPDATFRGQRSVKAKNRRCYGLVAKLSMLVALIALLASIAFLALSLYYWRQIPADLEEQSASLKALEDVIEEQQREIEDLRMNQRPLVSDYSKSNQLLSSADTCRLQVDPGPCMAAMPR